MKSNHLQTRLFSEEQWYRITSDGRSRSSQKAPFASTRLARKDTHELGMVGETLFGRLIGLPVNRDLLISGDGKVDFGSNIDVKTTSHFTNPWLRVTPDDLDEQRVFVLVAVDEHERKARYCGYATNEMVRRARICKMTDVMPASYTLNESELIKDLPHVA